MNAPQSTIPIPETATDSEAIAVALYCAPFEANSTAVRLLQKALESQFRRASVSFKPSGAAFTPMAVVTIYETSDRNAAFMAARRLLEEYGWLEHACIAYWDAAESFWRTMAGVAVNIDDICNPEALAYCEREAAASQERLQSFLKIFQAQAAAPNANPENPS